MKKRSIIWLGVLAIMLNSCVYSLFPIYTEDTLVFKSELLGTWDLGDNSYLIFQKGSQEDEEEDSEMKYTLEIKEGFTMSSDEPISIEIDGETVYDENRIREEMLRRMAENESEPTESKAAEKLDQQGYYRGEEKEFVLRRQCFCLRRKKLPPDCSRQRKRFRNRIQSPSSRHWRRLCLWTFILSPTIARRISPTTTSQFIPSTKWK